MDELLEKYLKGEITKEQYDEGKAKLPAEEQAKAETPEVVARVKKAADDELARIAALRKEGKRIEGNQTDFAAKLREENKAKAAKQFFTTFKIPTEDQEGYLKAFEENDSGHVDTDLILNDFKGIYAKEHADELLSAKQTVDTMAQQAEEFNASQGGAPGGGGEGGSSSDKRDPLVLEYVKEAARKGTPITYEAALQVLSRKDPMKRTFSI